MSKRLWKSLLYLTSVILLELFILPLKIYADQPKTNYDVNIYSQMITGYIADENLEILPEGELGLPTTMIVVDKSALSNKKCFVGEANTCDRTVRVRYPRQNDREEDLLVEGTCQRIPPPVKLNPNAFYDPDEGLCKWDQRPFHTQDFVGADNSSSSNDLAVPGWQSYNHQYTSNRCSGSTNALTYGSHDLILPTTYQAQLKLNMLWKAFITQLNYQKDNNPRKELPIGGINWKERVNVDGESIELIMIYFKLAGAKMAPHGYGKIWEREKLTSDPNDVNGITEKDIELNQEEEVPDEFPFPIPAYLQNETWLSKWLYNYKLSKLRGDEWVKYFDCTPLYPHDTDEPTLVIGSLVLGKATDLIPFNIALHDANLVSNFAARAGTEPKIHEIMALRPAGQGEEIIKEMGKKIPLLKHYFDLPKVSVSYMPTALVFGNGNTNADPNSATSENTETPFVPLTSHQLGAVLDYPNQVYNPIYRPAPRMPKYLKDSLSLQESKAVHIDSNPSVFEIVAEVLLKFIPHKSREYVIGSNWTQADRFLQKPSYDIFATKQELDNEDPLKDNPVNVIPAKPSALDPSKEPDLFPVNNRTHTQKDAWSRFMACRSDYRYDYENTPRQVAEGKAVNSCGEPATTASLMCDLDPSAPDDVEAALEVAAQAASQQTGIPANWLIAISKIEGGATQLGSKCQKHEDSSALGPMQLGDSAYEDVTCDTERLGINNLSCERPEGKLSRCNLQDSMVLAARLLLYKMGKLPTSCNPSPATGITTDDLYYASNNYYGICEPDSVTSGWKLPGVSRTPNYGDIACNLAGQSGTCNSLPQCR